MTGIQVLFSVIAVITAITGNRNENKKEISNNATKICIVAMALVVILQFLK